MLIVAGLCVFWSLIGSRLLPMARTHDFLNLYTGASLARDGQFAHLHDIDVQLAREQRIEPSTQRVFPFVRPHFYAALLIPLAWFPPAQAFEIWLALQCVLLALCWAWAWRRFGPDALVFAALSLPAPLGIASGQDCVLMLAIFVAAYELADRKKLAASGAVLALLLIKFHLVLLWPLALLFQKRWKMLVGFAAAGAAEILISLALGGVMGIRSYLALLTNRQLGSLSPSPELMISYEGLLANLGIESRVAAYALILAVILALLWALRGAPIWKTFAITAVASEFAVPHVYGYDAALLMLPLWLTIFCSVRPASRIAAALLSTPLPFGFALAGKPWAIVASASMLVYFAILASESPSPALKEEPEFART